MELPVASDPLPGLFGLTAQALQSWQLATGNWQPPISARPYVYNPAA